MPVLLARQETHRRDFEHRVEHGGRTALRDGWLLHRERDLGHEHVTRHEPAECAADTGLHLRVTQPPSDLLACGKLRAHRFTSILVILVMDGSSVITIAAPGLVLIRS